MNQFKENIELLCRMKQISRHDLLEELQLGVSFLDHPTLDELVRIGTYFNRSVDALIRNKLFNVPSKELKLLILDIDGVMTDGGMYYNEDGSQFKKFNAKDGMAVKALRNNDFQVGIISSGYIEGMIKSRAKTIDIEKIYVGRAPKIQILTEWCEQMGIFLNQVAYVGDDINDLEVMQLCGLTACPSDAVQKIKDIAHITLERKGGDACVREFIDEHLSPLLH